MKIPLKKPSKTSEILTFNDPRKVNVENEIIKKGMKIRFKYSQTFTWSSAIIAQAIH